MSRRAWILLAAVLTLVDAGIHLRRSLLPDGNPFGSALHEQFLLYTVVAVLLVVALLVGPRWLGIPVWIVCAALALWELGALGVWFISYHAPNPPGLVPDEGYVSKAIEVLIVVALLASLRAADTAHEGQRPSSATS